MIKLTLLLCAGIYASMVILSDRPAQTPSSEIATRSNFQPSAVVAGMPAETAAIDDIAPNDTLMLSNGEVIEISAVIRPSELDQGAVVSLVSSHSSGPSEVSVAVGPDEELDIVYVSGSMVNMRGGPSTSDAVTGAIGYGTMTQLIEDMGNGWSHIRDLTTGQTGYMASRFLTPSL